MADPELVRPIELVYNSFTYCPRSHDHLSLKIVLKDFSNWRSLLTLNWTKLWKNISEVKKCTLTVANNKKIHSNYILHVLISTIFFVCGKHRRWDFFNPFSVGLPPLNLPWRLNYFFYCHLSRYQMTNYKRAKSPWCKAGWGCLVLGVGVRLGKVR